MTWGWPALAALFVGSYALKATGLVALANRHLPTRVEELLGLLPAALFGALIVVSTFGDGQSLVLDARAAGLAAAAFAVWRRAGFVVVVLAAAVATATVRAIG
ncbi:MAG: AzlD domain-containing protein [Acidimicrobiia bacterium]|jgi:branched-subunit amino acid transport protein|nr:AzlD domain-containing protein [Acidimicrobiia bacterium]